MPIIRIAGKDVEIDKTRPITVRDWRELKKLGVNIMKSLNDPDPDTLTTLAIYLAKKANPEITDDDILSLPGPHLLRFLQLTGEKDEIDLPF